MKVKNAVWVNADRTKAVPAGDKEAAFLLLGSNGELADAEAKRLGISENGAEGQKEGAALVNASHMVTDATPDGINTAPDSPQAVEGLTRVTVAGNETKNKASVTIHKEADKAKTTSKPVETKRG